ncbi:hypothetical protein [Motilimonas sp. E26]|uniref:hypothetical protein n=1 Tax=Motilimonas sp. E26 TaxID=2865674 RepID=UPI001E61FDAA|nr:hypothetical protein [Motilimonas sp. E26]MCE0555839.1 hypothetical protein [Motilimonas sp. E26]
MYDDHFMTIFVIEMALFFLIVLGGLFYWQKQGKKRLQEQLEQAQLTIAKLTQALKAKGSTPEPQELRDALKQSQLKIDKLSQVYQAQIKLIKQVADISELPAETKGTHQNITEHIIRLKQQATESGEIIDEMTAALNESYLKFDNFSKEANEQEQKLKKLLDEAVNKSTTSAEEQAQMEAHAEAVGIECQQLTEKLSAAEQDITQYKMSVDSLEQELARLQQSSQKDETTTLKKQLAEGQAELSRIVREKDFIEKQFLELLDSAEDSTDLAAELTRAKNEYALLEQKFIEAESQRNDPN